VDFTPTVEAIRTDRDQTIETDNFDVTVNPVTDAPTLTVGQAVDPETGCITLDITAALADSDGSESLAIIIDGVPVGAVLSAGICNDNDGTGNAGEDTIKGNSRNNVLPGG
jgi:hypothetical protein